MQQRYLVTGANGFTGRHLTAHLACRPGAVVLATGRSRKPAVGLADYFACDLTNASAAAALIKWARPTTVFHLAVLRGLADERELVRANQTMIDHLCRAIERREPPQPTCVVAIGSAAELGPAGAAQLPVDERARCEPLSTYGRGKQAMVRFALAQAKDGPLRVVVARTFNLVGPGLDGSLSLGNFAHQLAAVSRGETSAIQCGSLHTRRDFLDVRDAVHAYTLLAERGLPGELYNVCAGQSHHMGDLLDQMIAMSGVRVRISASATADAADLPNVFGDNRKLCELTGWAPRIAIATSLWDLLGAAGALPRTSSRTLFPRLLGVNARQPFSQLGLPMRHR